MKPYPDNSRPTYKGGGGEENLSEEGMLQPPLHRILYQIVSTVSIGNYLLFVVILEKYRHCIG